jgi:antitoxin HicB
MDKSPNKINLNIIFRPEPEGGFTVLVPALPGCITFGEDLPHARAMAQEAIELYLESMIADGEEPPIEAESYLTTMEVRLPVSSKIKHAR